MTKQLTITRADLRGACRDQLDKFNELFPNGVTVRSKAWAVRLARKHAHTFDFSWLAGRLLTAPARAEYERVTAPAWAEYVRVRAPAWAEYERVRALAWAEYERVTALARVKYERVTALAFARLWWDQETQT